MCEIADKIFQEGIQQGIERGVQKGLKDGELKKAKEMALSLAEMGFTAEKIAQIAKVSVEQVKEWLSEDTVVLK